ncbi:type II secretion system F family protein [Candidatus Sumerlaeota bacterium]|nr:type II secretion system F family protein [Candidatus Sumerlaeota bacterium]
MPEFTYEALDKQGRQVKGVIEATSEEGIIEKLRDMGYYPLKVTPHKSKASDMDILALPGLRLLFHRITGKHIMTFSRQLATLIDAGLPIMRSLHILREQVESVIFKEKITAIAKDIESGSSLSDALEKHPKLFDKLYVNMVRAGEVGGVLEAVLNRVATFLEKRQIIISKVRSAMMYPIVVLTIGIGILAGILIFIMPKFAEMFDGLGATLPPLTLALIRLSDILVHDGIWVILGIIAIVLTVRQINKTYVGRFVFDTMKLKAPIFGTLFQKVAIARFASTLATLLNAGVPILQALDITRDSSGNEVVARAMETVYQSVKDGDTIHEPLSRCSIFPPLVYHMVAVGEETGAIDQMLEKVAEAYEREVDDMVDGLTALLEPILIVFLGAMVGTVVVALYLPLFSIPKIIK